MSALSKFKESLPNFIHVLRKKNEPLVWLPKKNALQYERFKIYGNNRQFLMFDYDHKDGKAVDHKQFDLEPNFVCYNPDNFNYQAFWELLRPVFAQKSVRQNKPYQYLKAIEQAYDEKYQGDKHFARYISRNPLYAFCDTEWLHDKKYSLGELAEVVQLDGKRIKKGERQLGRVGRNATVFDDLRYWAYRQDTTNINYVDWLQRCKIQALEYNAFKDVEPMDLIEVISIAKSVAQYTYNRHFSETFTDYVKRTHTSEIQSIRGKRSAEKRWSSHVKQEPWLDLGISRATWYRYQNSK